MQITELIREKKGTIVDVRTPEEFANGHVPSSINIPLQELTERMQEVKQLKTPLILCCASGGRSGMANAMLNQEGIESYNAGSWMTVKAHL